MLNALAEFFSPEAGQARRRWLNEQEQRFGNALAGYLGPAAQPIQNAALLAGYLTPGADMMDASQASREMFAAETPLDAAAAGAAMLGATGMVLLPGNYNALAQGFRSTVDDMTAAYDPSRVNALIAYHGSPHTFDRFSMDKIGTGEGAQAYGHGLYFAENEDVARAYRDQLVGDFFVTPAGTTFDPSTLQHLNVRSMVNRTGDPQAALDRAMALLPNANSQTAPMLQSDIASLERVLMEGGLARPSGSMYQVQIDADPSQLLDWDAPLYDQPEAVMDMFPGVIGNRTPYSLQRERDAILQEMSDIASMRDPTTNRMVDERRWLDLARERDRIIGMINIAESPSGGELYRRLSPSMGDSRAVAENLAARGIPGIQYLDAGSRAAGDGSRNFVIFDDSIIDILKRYGIGAAAVGGGWALAPQEAEAATNAGILDPQNRDRETIQSWLATQ